MMRPVGLRRSSVTERAFASEEDLVAQIAEDVMAARAATRPGA